MSNKISTKIVEQISTKITFQLHTKSVCVHKRQMFKGRWSVDFNVRRERKGHSMLIERFAWWLLPIFDIFVILNKIPMFQEKIYIYIIKLSKRTEYILENYLWFMNDMHSKFHCDIFILQCVKSS